MRFISEGNDAKVVMVGAGLNKTPKQSWPKVSNFESSVAFSSVVDFETASYQGFDGRTSPLSKKAQSTFFGGRLNPQANVAPTYEFRALDHSFDGATVGVETIIPNAPKSLALPSMLILALKTGAVIELIGVEYGSNGVRLISLLDGVVRYEYSMAYNIVGGSVLRVERFLSWIQVYVNGIRIGAATHPTFNLAGFPGVGFYSYTAPGMSTPIGVTKFFGGSSLSRTFGGMKHLDMAVGIPKITYVELMRMTVEGGRSMRAVCRNVRWMDNDGYNRTFTLKMNGSSLGNIGGLNGTDYQLSNPFTVPAKAVFTVEGYTYADPVSARTVKSGSVEIIPA